MIVLVVLGLAGVAVLGAVVLLAMGRGGELAATHPDYPPLPLGSEGPITGAEAAYLRLPRTVWGYQPELADEAVRRLARALSEREAEVADLQREVAELRYRAGDPVGALFGVHETAPPDGEDPRGAGLDAAGTGAADTGAPWAGGAAQSPEPLPDAAEPLDVRDDEDRDEDVRDNEDRDDEDRDGSGRDEGDGRS